MIPYRAAGMTPYRAAGMIPYRAAGTPSERSNADTNHPIVMIPLRRGI